MEHIKYWQLAQRQSLPLQAKINMSLRRITTFYEKLNGQVYTVLGFSRAGNMIKASARKKEG